MNKMFQKIAGALTACLLFSALPAEVVSAAGWIRSGTPGTEDGRNSGWWYSLSDDDSQWYAASGEETVAWHWIDGNRDGAAECYAFDASGWMYGDARRVYGGPKRSLDGGRSGAGEKCAGGRGALRRECFTEIGRKSWEWRFWGRKCRELRFWKR